MLLCGLHIAKDLWVGKRISVDDAQETKGTYSVSLQYFSSSVYKEPTDQLLGFYPWALAYFGLMINSPAGTLQEYALIELHMYLRGLVTHYFIAVNWCCAYVEIRRMWYTTKTWNSRVLLLVIVTDNRLLHWVELWKRTDGICKNTWQGYFAAWERQDRRLKNSSWNLKCS